MSLPALASTAWAVLAAVMTVLWAIQVRTRNAGPVDVAWAFGTGLAGAWLALGAAEGDPLRHLLVAALAAAWGTRLGLHLWRRVRAEAEDGRYRQLRARLGPRAQPFLLAFYQVQALWAVLFALPMWAAALSPAGLGWHDAAGVAVWLVALAGETVADAQLARFRADPSRRGQVCDLGLWRWSRHPNYFFEWLHWLAYVLIGLGSPHWWLTWAGLALMYLFLTRVTGIPWAEEQALRSRGEAYRRYQRETPMLIPRPPSAPRARGGEANSNPQDTTRTT